MKAKLITEVQQFKRGKITKGDHYEFKRFWRGILMKAKNIHEELEFTRTGDSKSSMGIGILYRLRKKFNEAARIYPGNINSFAEVIHELDEHLKDSLAKYGESLRQWGYSGSVNHLVSWSMPGPASLLLNPHGEFEVNNYRSRPKIVANLFDDSFDQIARKITGKVNESVNFQRTGDTKKGLGVGRNGVLKQWWIDEIDERETYNLSMHMNKIIRKIEEVAHEMGMMIPFLKVGGHGGGWVDHKSYTQEAQTGLSTFVKVKGENEFIFDIDIDEDGEVYADPNQFAEKKGEPTHKERRIYLGDWKKDATSLVKNYADLVFKVMRDKGIDQNPDIPAKFVRESLEFKRGVNTKDALDIGEWPDIRKKYQDPSNYNFREIGPEIQRILNSQLYNNKYDSVPNNFTIGDFWATHQHDIGRMSAPIEFSDGSKKHTEFLSLYLDFNGDFIFQPPGIYPTTIANLHENSPEEIIDAIYSFLNRDPSKDRDLWESEAIGFQRGITSRDSLEVGEKAQRRKWWNGMKRELNYVHMMHEVADDLAEHLHELGIQEVSISGIGKWAIGIEIWGREHEFDFAPDGEMYIRGESMGNFMESPEETVQNFAHKVLSQ